jgi:tetratricopeptide (TPR) repeat protein
MSKAVAFKAGIEAVQQRRYGDAIAILEPLCNGQLRPPEKAYYHAKMWLVRAYRGNGQLPQAIVICRQLATSSHPEVQVWANKKLVQLRHPASMSSVAAPAVAQSPAKSQMPATDLLALAKASAVLGRDEASQLLKYGIKAAQQKHFIQAIDLLETFLKVTPATYDDYGQGQVALAQVYAANDNLIGAITLAKEMTLSPVGEVQHWGKQFLQKNGHFSGESVDSISSAGSSLGLSTGSGRGLRSSNGSSTGSSTGSGTGSSAGSSAGKNISKNIGKNQAATSSSGTVKVASGKVPIQPRTQPPARSDFSTPILSGACYAAFYTGPILSFLLPTAKSAQPITIAMPTLSTAELLAAMGIGFMIWAAPICVAVAVLLWSRDRVAKANAREAINLWLTGLCLGLGWSMMVLILSIVSPPLMVILGLIGLLVVLIFSLAPLMGLIMCLVKPFEPFRFPLMWRVLG